MECLYYDDRKLKYKGEVVDGKPHGQGTGYWEDGKTVWYEGAFVNGKPQHYGKFYYGSGVLRYEGEHQDLMYVGQGREYFRNGQLRFEGTQRGGRYFFYNARLFVKGRLYYENGTLRYEGTFQGDKSYEFHEGVEYLTDGTTKLHVKEASHHETL